jgi:hypothetical protein
MSTKIEDLSDSEEDHQYEEEYDEEQYEEEVQHVEHFTQQGDENINIRIVNMIIEKVKHPFLVTLIMIFLTHPLLIQGIFKIPYMEIADQTISVNVMLSILAGIFFFILREFI